MLVILTTIVYSYFSHSLDLAFYNYHALLYYFSSNWMLIKSKVAMTR